MEYQDRESAPFEPRIWETIDRVAKQTLEEIAVGRKLLRVVGPLGIQTRVGIGEDRAVGEEEPGPIAGQKAAATHVHVPKVRTLPLLHQPFRLGLRSVEGFQSRGEPFDTRAVADAARSLALAEERIVFEGHAGAGIRGLKSQEGGIEVTSGDWSDPARVADDLLASLARLDEVGRHGPYAAAFSPTAWYSLFRPHPSTSLTPFAQLSPMFAGGMVKAPALHAGALVISTDDQGPRLLIGEDLVAAYDGREGIFHRFSLLESVTLLPGSPGTVAVIRGESARRPKGREEMEEERPSIGDLM